MHVALDYACRSKNFATNRVGQNVGMQPLAQARSIRKFKNASVINNARADIAAAQRNDPDPPAATEQMIGGPFSAGAATVGVIRKTLSPFVAVPLLDAAESGPNRIDGVLGVGAKMSQLAREHGRASGGIDNPATSDAAFAKIDNGIHGLASYAVQLALCYLGRAPEITPRFHGESEHVRIEFGSIHLKSWYSALIT